MVLKRYISASSIIASNIAKNLLMSSQTIQRIRSKKTRTYRDADNNEALRTFFAQRWGFLEANINLSQLKNQVVMEIGPGDHIALAVPLFSHGAAQYIARDRFLGPVLEQEKLTLYEESFEVLPSIDGVDTAALEKFSREWREHIEKKATLLKTALEIPSSQLANAVDLSFSFNVLEHVYNIEDSARSLFDSAKPGGVSVHRVDYSDHGIMGGENPFLWLCIRATCIASWLQIGDWRTELGIIKLWRDLSRPALTLKRR